MSVKIYHTGHYTSLHCTNLREAVDGNQKADLWEYWVQEDGKVKRDVAGRRGGGKDVKINSFHWAHVCGIYMYVLFDKLFKPSVSNFLQN